VEHVGVRSITPLRLTLVGIILFSISICIYAFPTALGIPEDTFAEGTPRVAIPDFAFVAGFLATMFGLGWWFAEYLEKRN
jgi:hypothetical protein